MAQTTRPPRQTRSSAACDSCRSKKQKCGGEWPTCARCRETGNECTWPPQLQRGPAKGYLEAIEARLDDVEHILLQVLPLVPSDQLLSSVTCLNDSAGHLVESNQKRSTQEKRAALDYWASFPLNSPHAVLAWYNDRSRRDSNRRAHQPPASAMDISSTPAAPSDTPRSTQVAEAPMEDATHHPPDPASLMTGPWPNHHPSHAADPQPGNASEASARGPALQANQDPTSVHPQIQDPPSISDSGRGGGFELSDEFHAKFLW
ncbi:Quinic acid utilization activator [Lasiodiplodia theobromae]|uniref:Quinic acid utilization activator n=1 Tax=Lasiodiplodia theobromae TaxID=45133 RepID=A0A5N5D8S9_9PEZI|nr:Quinic acid utilization activator [Lasiodiplodia theobromae]